MFFYTYVMPTKSWRLCACVTAAACACWLAGSRLVAQTARPEGIRAPASASAEGRADFVRGLDALHTFEYEDANEAFREAQRVDPGFALAYWGEAMTYHQTLWRREDIAAARRVLARLGASSAARAARANSATEKALIAAVGILFGNGDADARRRNYADAMGQLHARDGDDPDIAALYALALLGTMSRSLIGFDEAHEGHVRGLAGSETQTRVAEIVDAVLQAHPEHLGALHYLLHNYDDPDHARLGLAAARTLARLAPASSHARHMPAHIFLQLGLWRDAAAADRAAFDASSAWVARKALGPALRNYHALSWLQYELLQRGRYREASAAIDELEPVVKAGGELPLLSDLGSMRARFAIETRRWSGMGAERNFANVNDLFAIGVSAARTSNPELAERARQALATRAQSDQEGDLRPAIAIMEKEVAALLALAAGRTDEAVKTLQAAVSAELQLPPPLGLPEPLKPSPELLGEVLLETGRARDAIEPFEQALRRNPNRSLSVLGRARAAAATGDLDTARARYRELLVNLDGADPGLPEAEEARRALQASTVVPPSRYLTAIVAGAIAAVAFAAIAMAARHMRTDKTRRRVGAKKRARR
jgi:tetratricopeptide (TPR) repeat protein